MSRVALMIGLGLWALSAACAMNTQTASDSKNNDATRAPVIDPASVELTKPIHFATPDGSDLVAPAGTYHLDNGEGSQLRLSPADGKAPLLIAALMVEHDVDLIAPLALIIPIEEDRQHLVLVQPGGTALDAVGSASGVMTRGPLQPIPSTLLAQALSAKVSKMGPTLGRIDLSKMRIPVSLSVQPTAPIALFQDCGQAQSGGYLDTVYTQQVNTGAPYNPNLDNASGKPFMRMTAGSRKEFRCAIGAVTVKPTAGSLVADDQLQLQIVSYVYGYGAWVRDRYQLTPSNNAPLTFPNVIMATFDLGSDPNQLQQHKDAAAKSLTTGYLVGVEVFLNGEIVSKLPCLFRVPPGGVGTLACAANAPFPPGM